MPASDLKRLKGLAPELAAIAEKFEGYRVRGGTKARVDLRWLSTELPKLLEEREELDTIIDRQMENQELILELAASQEQVTKLEGLRSRDDWPPPTEAELIEVIKAFKEDQTQLQETMARWQADFAELARLFGITKPEGVEVPQFVIEQLQAIAASPQEAQTPEVGE